MQHSADLVWYLFTHIVLFISQHFTHDGKECLRTPGWITIVFPGKINTLRCLFVLENFGQCCHLIIFLVDANIYIHLKLFKFTHLKLEIVTGWMTFSHFCIVVWCWSQINRKIASKRAFLHSLMEAVQ